MSIRRKARTPVARRKLRAWRMETFLKRAAGAQKKQNVADPGQALVGEVLPPETAVHRHQATPGHKKTQAASEPR